MLFKALVIQSLYNLSDKQPEYRILDRMSFRIRKKSNREKSGVRARVEHIFGFVENNMNGSYIRIIGVARAKAKIGMMNIVYNISRCVQLKKVVCMG